MFSARKLVLSIILATSALAIPSRSQNDVRILDPSPFTPGQAGALYFMTNDPSGNYIVTARISHDGSMKYNRAVSTGARGSHGVNGGSVSLQDATFSQGSVTVSSAAQILAAVNPGGKSVSLFSINPLDPADIDLVGGPTSSGGEFPVSVAFNKDGSHACVLNGGKVAGVNCFRADRLHGLTPIHNSLRSIPLNQTTPPNGPAGTASQVLFSSDGKKLMVAVKGTPPTPGYIAIWDVESDGSLSSTHKTITVSNGGMLPFSISLIPGTNSILSADPAVGYEIIDLSTGKTTVTTIVNQTTVCWSTYSPKTKNFYLVDAGGSTLYEVDVDKNLNSKVVQTYPQTAGSGTIDPSIATISGKDYLYVLAANTASVDVFALDGPGHAKRIGTFGLTSEAKKVGLAINNPNLQGMATYVPHTFL